MCYLGEMGENSDSAEPQDLDNGPTNLDTGDVVRGEIKPDYGGQMEVPPSEEESRRALNEERGRLEASQGESEFRSELDQELKRLYIEGSEKLKELIELRKAYKRKNGKEEGRPILGRARFDRDHARMSQLQEEIGKLPIPADELRVHIVSEFEVLLYRVTKGVPDSVARRISQVMVSFAEENIGLDKLDLAGSLEMVEDFINQIENYDLRRVHKSRVNFVGEAGKIEWISEEVKKKLGTPEMEQDTDESRISLLERIDFIRESCKRNIADDIARNRPLYILQTAENLIQGINPGNREQRLRFIENLLDNFVIRYWFALYKYDQKSRTYCRLNRNLETFEPVPESHFLQAYRN